MHPDQTPAGTVVPVDLNDPLADLDQAFRLAKMLAQSSMVPQALRNSPQNCLVTMLLGRELGLSWIQAIRGIYVLPSGQPGLRGALLLARIRAAGHRYEFIESDDACEFVLTRKDEEFKIRHTGRFTLDDAKAAGLVHEKDGKLIARSGSGQPLPWESYRRDMLQWRAVARGAARGCPEIIFGFDLAGIGDGEPVGTLTAEVVPVAPATGGGQDVREKLAQLDRQHGEPDIAPVSLADYDVTKPEQPVLEEPPGEAPEEPARPPGLPELHELLRRCGYNTAAGQIRVCAVLVHRDLSDMSQLTPGEIFMVHAAVSREAVGHTSMAARHQALEAHLDAEKMEAE